MQEQSKIVKIINDHMNSTSPDIEKHLAKYNIDKTWNMGRHKLVHKRYIRGDTVELFFDEDILVEWVDQTHQYGSGIGVHDYKSNITLSCIKDIFGIKKPKKHKFSFINLFSKKPEDVPSISQEQYIKENS